MRVEDLCWVLDDALLRAVTGVPWDTFCDRMDESSNNGNDNNTAAAFADLLGGGLDGATLALRFKRQKQLAEYYVGQLNLFARMCVGRSYNCIDWFVPSFPYETLCSLVYNAHLPAVVRAAAIRFCASLYLDRFPQLIQCGRPSLPEQLWIYQSEADAALAKNDRRSRARTTSGFRSRARTTSGCRSGSGAAAAARSRQQQGAAGRAAGPAHHSAR